MSEDESIDALPTTLAVALRLHRAGADQGTLAAALGIDAEGVPGLLEVAEAKLAHLLAGTDGRRPAGGANAVADY